MLIISYGMKYQYEVKATDMCGAFESLKHFDSFESVEAYAGRIVTWRKIEKDLPMSLQEWKTLHSNSNS